MVNGGTNVKKAIKKILSMILAMSLLLNFAVLPTYAVADNMLDYELEISDSTITNDAEKLVTIAIKLSTPISANGVGYTVICEDGIDLSGVSAIEDSNFNLSSSDYNDGTVAWGTSDMKDVILSDIGLVTVRIPAGTAAGDYDVTISGIEITNENWEYPAESDSVTATITVEDPTAPAADYEIWYELDSDADTLTNNYMDYAADSDVTATVYIVSNNADVTLQAYDIYLTYGTGLSYKEETMAGVAYEAGAAANTTENNTAADAGDTVTHIQLVADSSKNISLTKGVKQSLGTIVFTFTNDAQYDIDQHITLGSGTNIAIANVDSEGNAIGNANTYTAEEGGAVSLTGSNQTDKGAELVTTYAVTYNANAGTDTVTGMPTNGEKQHNVAYTIANGPTREGYSFRGWSTTEGENNSVTHAEGTSYTTNEVLNLYAVWQKGTVTITWMNDGVQYGETDEISWNTVPTAPTTNPTKAPDAQYTYGFLGWNTDPDAEAAMTLTAVTEDTTYYAIYSKTLNKYTVTWYDDEGKELRKDTGVDYGTTPSYGETKPTKAATDEYTYTFAGWSATQGGEVITTLPIVDSNESYYAVFTSTKNHYTVTYNENGTIKTETKDYGTQITLPTTATDKPGYTFSGWNTVETPTTENPGTSYQPGASYTVTGNQTLYAQYTANKYTVVFNKNADDATGTMNNQEFTYDVAQKLTANGFTRTGWSFNGWNTMADGTGTTYNNEQEVSNLATSGEFPLYAQWTKAEYKVEKGTVENGSITLDKEMANYKDTITVTVTPNAGYSIGTVTYTPENGTALTIDPVDGVYSFEMPAANVTVNATFTANDYTVTVTTPTNGTVKASKTEQVHVGETITLTVSPATGYKLKSLTYTDADGKAQNVTVSDGTYSFTMPAANTTVTAEFESIAYTIKFDKNDDKATGTMNNIDAVYGETYTPTNAFTKTGYTFAGWTTTADGTNPQTTVSNLTTTDGDTVTLFAQWTPNTDTKYVVKHWQMNLGAAADAEKNESNYTVKDTDNLTGTSDSKVTPAVKSYDGFTAPTAEEITIAADGFTVVNYYYTRNSYSITFKDGETVLTDLTITAQYGAPVTAPAGPTKNGYTFKEWSPAIPNTMLAKDMTVSATWNLVTYSITYKDGDTVIDNLSPATYTIESTDTLPTYSKTNYTFKGWKVTETVEGSTVWAQDSVFNATDTTAVTGKYGNVTLTAVWDVAFNYVVEEYKYAGSNYVMLRIETASNVNAYTFNNAAMYYSDAATYKLNNNPVFFTLIPAEYAEYTTNDAGEKVLTGKLTSDGIDKVVKGDSAAATIDYSAGDINGDGVTNIADANIVYQMTLSGGGYYADLSNSATGRTDIMSRLMADMDRTTAGVHHASIEDVNAIVNIINGYNTAG